MAKNPEKQIIDLIKRSKRILIMPSSPPDGDAVGSAVALYLALTKLQKEVTIVANDPVPEFLQFLPKSNVIGNKILSSNDFIISINTKEKHIDTIKTSKDGQTVNIVITPKKGHFSESDLTFNKGEISYDLIITVDCAELSQLRSLYDDNTEMFYQVPVINIDHHISNTHFGKVNYVDIMASSTTELLLPLLEQISHEEGIELINEDVATLLLTGIITDTGSFQNANTTPRAFAKAAKLISYGARQQEIIQHIYKTKQLSQLKLWGRVLSKIQTDEDHKLVWSTVSQQDFKDTESSEEQTGDIIDELMTNAPGAEIVILIKEKQDHTISVSVRTTTPAVDASKFAEMFGGGGHTQAAGFRISQENLLDAEYQVISAAREFQAENYPKLKYKEEEPQKQEEKPLIDVSKLMKQAEQAQKASDIMKKVAKPESKESSKTKNDKKHKDSKKEKELRPGTVYKFED